jgi:hypothetical protein
MDHQPLNTGEQKDMAEFFIDLVSKLEEMTPELKNLVKTLFGGVISNNVVSLVSGLCANIVIAVLLISELSHFNQFYISQLISLKLIHC